MRVWRDGQIGPVTHALGEIGHRRRNPLIADAICRGAAEALAKVGIIILEIGKAAPLERFTQRRAKRRPLRSGQPTDGQGAAITMNRRRIAAGEVEIMLELAEIGEDIAPCPAFSAQVTPLVIIAWVPAIRPHTVDIRPTADTITLDIGTRRAATLSRRTGFRGEAGPLKSRIARGDRRKGGSDVGMFVARRHILPGLDQQNLPSWVLGQPVRENTARGSSADDDGVEYPVQDLTSTWRCLTLKIDMPDRVACRRLTASRRRQLRDHGFADERDVGTDDEEAVAARNQVRDRLSGVQNAAANLALVSSGLLEA